MPTLANILRGNNLLATDFTFDDTAKKISVSTGAGSSVKAAIDDAIDDAIAALPADKFLEGLGGYNAATNTLTLNMSDGSTVGVDLTALINDAVASVATVPTGTESVEGKLQLATSAITVTGTDTAKATHSAGVKAAIDAAFAAQLDVFDQTAAQSAA